MKYATVQSKLAFNPDSHSFFLSNLLYNIEHNFNSSYIMYIELLHFNVFVMIIILICTFLYMLCLCTCVYN